jgi:hypothetical protein
MVPCLLVPLLISVAEPIARYATWDLAFHTVAFAHVDPDFAKNQLMLFLREWYMHPNGALPAYEWNFSDVNPPVHAWAAWQVYRVPCRLHSLSLVLLFSPSLIPRTDLE